MRQRPGQNMRVVVIEDDDTVCQIKMGANRFKTIVTLIDSYNSALGLLLLALRMRRSNPQVQRVPRRCHPPAP